MTELQESYLDRCIRNNTSSDLRILSPVKYTLWAHSGLVWVEPPVKRIVISGGPVPKYTQGNLNSSEWQKKRKDMHMNVAYPNKNVPTKQALLHIVYVPSCAFIVQEGGQLLGN